MRRFLRRAATACVFALALVVGTVGSVSAAASRASAPTRVATDSYPCEDQQFGKHQGGSAVCRLFGTAESLSASVWVDIDPTRTNVYCGSVQTEGQDSLDDGCVHFGGESHSPWGFDSSYYVYHCSHIGYTFWGPVQTLRCDSGDQIHAEAWIQEYSDVAFSPYYTC